MISGSEGELHTVLSLIQLQFLVVMHSPIKTHVARGSQAQSLIMTWICIAESMDCGVMCNTCRVQGLHSSVQVLLNSQVFLCLSRVQACSLVVCIWIIETIKAQCPSFQ